MRKYLAGLAVVVMATLGLNVQAHASLVVSGTGTITGVAGSYQLIYDTDLDITWLDYSKYKDDWYTQMTWAGNLEVTVNGVTYENWRLPSAGTNPVEGYNQTTSEMGHLYYNEFGLLSYPDRGNTDVAAAELNAGVFDNLIASIWYLTGTEVTLWGSPTNRVYDFCLKFGVQRSITKSDPIIAALAVMPGQIQSVPEPASMLLVASSIAGLIGLKRRKK